jgi:hypothetical protein
VRRWQNVGDFDISNFEFDMVKFVDLGLGSCSCRGNAAENHRLLVLESLTISPNSLPDEYLNVTMTIELP